MTPLTRSMILDKLYGRCKLQFPSLNWRCNFRQYVIMKIEILSVHSGHLADIYSPHLTHLPKVSIPGFHKS